MQSPEITTVIKMMESLPEPKQKQVVEYLRNYIEELQDDAQWDYLIEKTQSGLAKAAQDAKRQIREGLSEPMDENRL